MVITQELKDDWMKRIDEHKGTVSENSLLVPYRIDDVYGALLRLHERINHGILFEKDPDSKSVLFGAKKSIWTGGPTFKGYSTLESDQDNGNLIYMYVKVIRSDQALQELFNELTDILEKEYTRSASYESVKSDSVDIYDSKEYGKKKNRYVKKQSKYAGVYYIIIGSLLLIMGLSGHYVLRFTNSSEALTLVSLIPLGYGTYRLVKGFSA